MNSCIFLYDMRHYHLSKMFLRLKGGSSYLQCLANFDSEEALEACKRRVEIIANTLGLEGFSRIDAFVNVHTGEVNLLVFFTNLFSSKIITWTDTPYHLPKLYSKWNCILFFFLFRLIACMFVIPMPT